MNIMRGLFTAFLALFVSGAAAMGSQPAAENPTPSQELPQNAVIAYYFHGNFRCLKCTSMEASALKALKEGFGRELKDGSLIWRPTNTDLPENSHFVKDYQLVTRSLVLVKIKDGKQVRWSNLARIWQLENDGSAFKKYIQDEAKSFLKGAN